MQVSKKGEFVQLLALEKAPVEQQSQSFSTENKFLRNLQSRIEIPNTLQQGIFAQQKISQLPLKAGKHNDQPEYETSIFDSIDTQHRSKTNDHALLDKLLQD